jgi:hypothetical protein
MRADLVRLLQMLEHGYTISLKKPDSGDIVFYDKPEKLKTDFDDGEHLFEVTDIGGNYATVVVKKDYQEPLLDNERVDRENMVLLGVANRIAAKYGASEEALEAVRGYLLSKIESLKRRLVKYYGFKWLDFVESDTSLKEAVIRFIQGHLRQTIEKIVLSYMNKANYVHEGKVHHLNVNMFPVTQAEDEEKTEPPAGDKFSEPMFESVAGAETRRLKREKAKR